MFVKRIPPSVIRFSNGAEITLSKKIGSAILNLQVGDTIRRTRELPDSETEFPAIGVEAVHRYLDDATPIIETLKSTISHLDAAIAVLSDQTATVKEVSPVTDAAMLTISIAHALRLAQPDVDLSEIPRTLEILKEARAELAADLEVVVARKAKLDIAAKRMVLVAMTHKNSDLDTIVKLANNYELPDAIAPQFLSLGYDKMQAKCLAILAEEDRLDRINKAEKRTAKRKEVATQLERIWS
jgi:hypothetical protein